MQQAQQALETEDPRVDLRRQADAVAEAVGEARLREARPLAQRRDRHGAGSPCSMWATVQSTAALLRAAPCPRLDPGGGAEEAVLDRPGVRASLGELRRGAAEEVAEVERPAADVRERPPEQRVRARRLQPDTQAGGRDDDSITTGRACSPDSQPDFRTGEPTPSTRRMGSPRFTSSSIRPFGNRRLRGKVARPCAYQKRSTSAGEVCRPPFGVAEARPGGCRVRSARGPEGGRVDRSRRPPGHG